MAVGINHTGPAQIDKLGALSRPPQLEEGTVPVDTIFFKPAKGISTVTTTSETPREYGPVVKNLMIHRGHYISRPGITTLGPAASDPLMHSIDLHTASGTLIPLRVTTKKMQIFSGLVWTDVPGATFTGGETDFFSFTSFGDKLIFTNNVDGIFEFDPGTVSITQLGATILTGALQLTTFDNRVIATNVRDVIGGPNPIELRWSTKNDERFWDPADTVNIGAGFEPLISSPGSDVDVLQGTFPLTDSLALIVRLRSIWLMSVTGNVDAPFQFSLLFNDIGCQAPRSLVRTPLGIVGLYDDDFYVISQNGPQPIGTQIIDILNDIIQSPEEVYGAYDSFRKEYRVTIKEDGGVYRYSFRDQGWTRDLYPFVVRTLSAAHHLQPGLVIDQLQGTIDSLVGTIDSLSGSGGNVRGMNLVQKGSGGQFVTYENPSIKQDVDTTGAAVDSPVEIRTGLVLPTTPLEKVEMVEIQLEYECTVAQTLNFEWSPDNGNSWNNFSSGVVINPTQGPEILSVVHQMSAKKMQIRVTSPILGGVVLIALHAFITRGPRVKP